MITRVQEVLSLILVDTSVIIDLLKDEDNVKTEMFKTIIKKNWSFGISACTYQEVLQGARNDNEYALLNDYLKKQVIYMLPNNISTYENVARIYYILRRKGITPRNSIDIYIAQTAIHFGLILLHNDSDFDNMALQIKDLNIVNEFN